MNFVNACVQLNYIAKTARENGQSWSCLPGWSFVGWTAGTIHQGDKLKCYLFFKVELSSYLSRSFRQIWLYFNLLATITCWQWPFKKKIILYYILVLLSWWSFKLVWLYIHVSRLSMSFVQLGRGRFDCVTMEIGTYQLFPYSPVTQTLSYECS